MNNVTEHNHSTEQRDIDLLLTRNTKQNNTETERKRNTFDLTLNLLKDLQREKNEEILNGRT